MRYLQCWKLKIIGALIIVTYCQALQQEIGEECTNKNGVVGFCQLKNKCSKDTDLGAICNSEQNVICCAKNIFKERQYINSSEDQKNQSIQSRFGFIPDFFHASVVSPQNPISNINFFNQKQNIPNFVGNNLHHTLNTLQFVQDRPYQNVEQNIVTKTNKQKYTSTRPTNEYDFLSSNNNQNIFNNDQTTRKTQNYYNYPNYEINRPNQNTNNYYPNTNNYNPNYQSTPNIPQYITQKPNQNQNNNFNKNPNHYTSTQNVHNNNHNSGNYEYNSQLPFDQISSNNYEENIRPNQNKNRPSSSSILFPDRVTDDISHTKFTSTTKPYGYQNRPNENAKRISEIKCEEYSKSLTTTISALPLSIDTASKPVAIEVCDSKSVGLIVGGSKAELGEFPHMVAIGFRATYGNPWNCGGTLISERFVLTAAHCTHSAQGKPVRVRLGELNLQKNNDGANPIDILVEEIIVHPDYVSTSKYNDIALIRLSNKVKFNDHIRPACLYNNKNIYSRKVTATGWGSIEYGSSSSDDLLKVNLDVINNQQCNKLYEAESKTNTLNKGIVDSMICAGYLAGGHDTCLGDSGGPLVIRSEKNACIFNLIGITSFGKFCAAENSPGVYTKVSAFLPWIEQIVWP